MEQRQTSETRKGIYVVGISHENIITGQCVMLGSRRLSQNYRAY